MKVSRYLLVLTLVVIYKTTSCGSSGNKTTTTPQTTGVVDNTFTTVANTYDIPRKILLGVAAKESGLSPQTSSVLYSADQSLGLSVGDSAFGLSLATIGLEDTAANQSLLPQIEAYGAFVRKSITEANLTLDSSIDNLDELYDWIWFIARLHRSGTQNRKNVQIIFALELIDIMNRGFLWQSDDTGDIVRLEPEATPITPENFSSQIQRNLSLDTQKSEIFSVDYMQLSFTPDSTVKNVPSYIRVIHCPFSLSSCLEIQSKSLVREEARLQAHYVIPPDETLISNPIKILQHRTPVVLTNDLGRPELISDAVVIMLVGDSGRYVNGDRLISNPLWFTNYQLKTLGNIVFGICELMKQDNPQVDIQECKTPGVERGVQFTVQGDSETYRWGNIPDFTKDIFWTYIKDPDELAGSAGFIFPQDNKIFQAGEPINFAVEFIRGASKVEIELLESCENGKSVWSRLQTHFIRDTARLDLDTVLYQKGPNGNGRHFLRALIYDDQNRLSAWQITDLYLENFESGSPIFANIDSCFQQS
ncbi:MAG: hypothetical protein HRU19_17745 [Pseudobacteriovorax sp.]|nr:hypothetical protein [Pseudobacteriovorax sp.]